MAEANLEDPRSGKPGKVVNHGWCVFFFLMVLQSLGWFPDLQDLGHQKALCHDLRDGFDASGSATWFDDSMATTCQYCQGRPATDQ